MPQPSIEISTLPSGNFLPCLWLSTSPRQRSYTPVFRFRLLPVCCLRSFCSLSVSSTPNLIPFYPGLVFQLFWVLDLKGPALMGVWSKAPTLTARCLSPLAGSDFFSHVCCIDFIHTTTNCFCMTLNFYI